MSSSQKRIAGALMVGTALIAGAFLLRSHISKSEATVTATTAIVATPERAPIATTDNNNDGVPDWQEALVHDETIEIPGANTLYQSPDTLTEKFALEFFQNVVRSKNYGDFGATDEELVQEADLALAHSATDILLSEEDITISGDSSSMALSTYGERVVLVLNAHPGDNTESETAVLQNAMRDQNPDELQKLDENIKLYKLIFAETQEIPAPSLMVKQHLDLLNTYQAIIADIEAMRGAFEDPMYAMVRLKRYEDDAKGLLAALTNMFEKLTAEGAVWDSTSPVHSFMSISQNN